MRTSHLRTSLIPHPFLWALYPPLALLGQNIEQLAPGTAVRSMLAALLLAGIVLLTARLALRDWDKAAIFTSLFMIAFFSYGHVYALVEDRGLFGITLGRHRFLGPLYLLLLGAIMAALWRSKDVRPAKGAFSWIGLVMVCLPLFQIVSYSTESYLATQKLQREGPTAELADLRLPEGQTPPDIYFIILDTYTRADVLAELFAFDNSPFLEALAMRGFVTTDCSQSNYPSTALSLTSSLNMSYLAELDERFALPNTNEHELYPYLWNNRVMRALEKLGYQTVAFDSGYSPTELRQADEYYAQDTDPLGILLADGINPYESMLLNTSAGMFVYELSPHLPERVQKFLALDTAYVVHRNRILYTLNRLERLGGLAGPKFVLVHILAPHNPFVFGPNGEYIERQTSFTLNDDRDVITMEDYTQGYVGQVLYLNQRMLTAIDAILAESAQPPIILIQGDHGVPRLKAQQNAILSTFLLPEVESVVYDSISPVNSFRLILNSYFGGQLDLLEDSACVSSNDAPFECIPLADPNPLCAGER
jgi:hypothetical protein